MESAAKGRFEISWGVMIDPHADPHHQKGDQKHHASINAV
jgi:hypothetical protein